MAHQVADTRVAAPRRSPTAVAVASRRERITELVAELGAVQGGPSRPTEELFCLVYDELRRLARRFMANERRDHTLQATALVHEAYLRLVDRSRTSWRDRNHFFAVSARVMRHVLIDHARGRGREKRGGGWQQVTLAEGDGPGGAAGADREQILALDQALDRLSELDAREARIVELRYFAGLTVPEIADVLGVSTRTVEADWTHARAWLLRELAGEAR